MAQSVCFQFDRKNKCTTNASIVSGFDLPWSYVFVACMQAPVE